MPNTPQWDFDGWATRNDILCTDGRTIRDGAFKHNDGVTVPLVYQHEHGDPKYVLGHCLLEYVPGKGMYTYGSFNSNEMSQDVKELVKHGDLNSLSIYANELKQNGGDVIHGSIKEVSLVLAGANKGAKIVNTYFSHADGSVSTYDDEAIINFYEPINLPDISHADDTNDKKEEKDVPDNKEKTVEDVINTMNEEQKNVLMFLIAKASEGNEAAQSDADNDDDISHSDHEGGDHMKHNLFDSETDSNVIQHADALRTDLQPLFTKEGRSRNSIGSMKEYVIEHAADYGIEDIDFLFPDARELNVTPSFVKRDDSWVDDFMNNAKHSPLSRVKTTFADITADEARAKGYTKGKRKIEEVFTLLKRKVEPTTVYKKQKLDRDDILDITSFDIVVWLKMEMRGMLNEEIARAALIGDGRSTASDDKIDETKIIPIWTDDEFYSINIVARVSKDDTDEAKATKIMKAIKKAYRQYKGSGNPTGYFSGEWLTNMTLIEDGIGREKYETPADVAKALRLKKVVDVELLENQTRTVTGEGISGGSETRKLIGICVNPIDYQFGADKGGAVTMFEDFDIDFNQQKYLMETRCSGMLIKPFSAMVIEMVEEDAAG